MLRWVREHPIISIVITLVFLFFIIIMPLLINKVYYLDAPCEFMKVGYDVSDLLGYYGSILTFIGTVSLGVITVYQNHLSQEINRLTLELQKKSMEMEERNYESQRQDEAIKTIPRFELKNVGSNGRYMNLNAELKNISNNTAAGLKSLSFKVFDEKKIL